MRHSESGQTISEYLSIIGCALLVICIIVGMIYITFFAPCENLGWLSLHMLPSRCLSILLPH